jgi:RimJ/RimL family protein N-acetyltransferase
MDATEARSVLETWAKGWPESVTFAVRTLVDDRLVGLARLYDIIWSNGHALLGLSIPDPEERGKGFGRDALALILRYGFDELGLHRIWLDTVGYNQRAIHMYERAGFREEGRLREHLYRDGRRFDVVLMGLLREEFGRDGGG